MAASNLHVSLAPEPLFTLGGLTVTNSMLTAALSTVLIGGALYMVARRLQLKPAGGFAGVIEAICDAILSQLEQILGSRDRALKHFPLLATIFLFILANNWIALLPGFNTIMLGEVPLFRAMAADLNAAIMLAIISVVATQVYAIQKLGVIGNLKRYTSKNPLMAAIGGLEAVLESTRVISFSFRLFGNIFAGEVLLIVIAALVPVLGPTPFWGLELFVGFIQAFVFTMLTTVFIAMATSDDAHAH